MIVFPAIDLYGGKAVRLYKGDYDNMTVYSDSPVEVAMDFKRAGATHMHLVDLEGARSGETPNLDVIKEIVSVAGMFVELGGGIRSLEVIDKYISAGVSRVILGTAAVKDRELLVTAIERYGDKIAVGVDIRDGYVAIKGWVESSELEAFAFCRQMEELGVKTIICTDISKDGAMKGANHELYRRLSSELSINIVASGGVSSIEDVRALRSIDLYGAIIGKAYYVGAIDLKCAIEEAK
ncbi:MAG: 1-(5-phosphoribosyl)-5-[Clostridia bacterium]|nr:1-(5-phosphoribosyl)-5-[(5-phosphoribosylamino)methylideneamino]imidazole-4-carboxamide isomerase [Clostridia bacterium]